MAILLCMSCWGEKRDGQTGDTAWTAATTRALIQFNITIIGTHAWHTCIHYKYMGLPLWVHHIWSDSQVGQTCLPYLKQLKLESWWNREQKISPHLSQSRGLVTCFGLHVDIQRRYIRDSCYFLVLKKILKRPSNMIMVGVSQDHAGAGELLELHRSWHGKVEKLSF